MSRPGGYVQGNATIVKAVGTTIPEFRSIMAAARFANVYRSSIARAIAQGTKCRGYWWRDANLPESRQPVLTDSRRGAKGISVKMVGSMTPALPSISFAARWLGVSHSVLRYAIENGVQCCGHWWRDADMPDQYQPPLASRKRGPKPSRAFVGIDVFADVERAIARATGMSKSAVHDERNRRRRAMAEARQQRGAAA